MKVEGWEVEGITKQKKVEELDLHPKLPPSNPQTLTLKKTFYLKKYTY